VIQYCRLSARAGTSSAIKPLLPD
ncbi:hypothetical protein D046_1966B, partial [Vibrio parahaemolyticus V-223/04]